MMVHTEVLRTPRLRLRWFEPASEVDQQFVIELLNDPDWIANIGKRDVSTREQAEAYLRDGPRAMCEKLGFGLYMVEEVGGAEAFTPIFTPIGMCGLLKRDHLPDVDIGFAYLPAWRGRGIAREAAEGVLRWAHARHGIQRVLAIVTPGNDPSLGLLKRLGFADEGLIQVPPNNETLRLLAWAAGPA